MRPSEKFEAKAAGQKGSEACFLHVENIFGLTTQASGFTAGRNRAGYWGRLLIRLFFIPHQLVCSIGTERNSIVPVAETVFVIPAKAGIQFFALDPCFRRGDIVDFRFPQQILRDILWDRSNARFSSKIIESGYWWCVVRGSRKISAPFPVTMATPKAGAPLEPAQPWLTERE